MAQGWGRVNLDPLFQEDDSVVTFDQDFALYVHNAE